MSDYNYDDYYQELDYFGKPYPDLVNFFKSHNPKGKVLDLGCGQGRDAIMLAGLGYDVLGVDVSRVGIEQMLEKALTLGLKVEASIADIYSYQITQDVDLVLMDSMLHFYKKDKHKESQLVLSILNQLKPGAILVNCLQAGKTREAHLKAIVKNHPADWQVIEDRHITYPDFNATYHMYVVKKCRG